MAVRSKPHRDLTASFHRLRRMVVDVKSARRSIIAQHGLLADLVSATLYPPFRDSLAQAADLSASGGLSSLRPGRPLPPPSPPVELPQDRDETDSFRPVFPPPLKASKKGSPRQLQSLRLKISALLSASPVKIEDISSRGTHEESSDRRRILASDAYPGKRYSQPAFWMPLLLAFLCFFLYTGKEVAVVVAVSAYSVLWITRRIRMAVRDCFARSQAFDPVSPRKDHSVKDSQAPPSSRSLPALCDFPEKGSCAKGSSSKGSGELYRIRKSPRTVEVSANFLPRVKLSFILILALCGLAYSHVIALCLCSCCILLLSVQQELAMRMGWRNS